MPPQTARLSVPAAVYGVRVWAQKWNYCPFAARRRAPSDELPTVQGGVSESGRYRVCTGWAGKSIGDYSAALCVSLLFPTDGERKLSARVLKGDLP